MNKTCKIIIAIVFVLALIGLGFLYCSKIQGKKAGVVSFESFKRIESDGKVFMENKDIGLKFMVPEGWRVENASWSSISVVSQDFIPFNNDMANAPLGDIGCWVDITIEVEKKTRDYVNGVATLIKEINSFSKEGVSVVKVDGRDSLRSVFLIGEESHIGEIIYVETPNNNITYTFQLSYLNNNSNCLKTFGGFLDAVFITNNES